MKAMKRAWWIAAVVASVSIGVVGPSTADTKKAAKETPLKVNASIKPKIDKRIEPYTWGMSSADVFKIIESQINEAYEKKISAAYNPKQVEQLEKQRDKAKKEAHTKLTDFKGGAGVSGYEMKAPHEFTYKNGETALEVSRPGGGERQLFFINDTLWKVYDLVPLGAKESEMGDTFEASVAKLTAEFGGDKGKSIAASKTPTESYYGTLGEYPALNLWTDGKTQVRLVDNTKREDMPQKTVGIAFEDVAMLAKLPTLRSNTEKKMTDAQVDNAGYTAPVPSTTAKKK